MSGYPEIFYFFGRFHPLVLHLPIGILLLVFLMECYRKFKQRTDLTAAIEFGLFWAAVSAVISAALGYLLSLEGGYETDLLFWHQWSGIGLALNSVFLYFLFQKNHRFYFPGFILTLALLAFAGHQGGQLTHGSHFLKEHQPKSLSSWLAWPVGAITMSVWTDSTKVYADMIQPIFDAKCISCHQTNKKKGGLLLDTPANIQKGGDSGPVLLAGNTKESLLIERIQLPESIEEHMPPKGKIQLDEDEIVLLKWWIDQGASFDQTLGRLEKNTAIQEMIEKRKNQSSGVYALNISKAAPNKLKRAQVAGIPIYSIAKDHPFLEVNLSDRPNVDAAIFKELKAFAPQIISLDLGNTNLDDNLSKRIKNFPNLLRLYLDQTAITDEAIDNLSHLNYLEFLNLYQTKISDEGLAKLSDLKKLKSLYLWQTNTTAEGQTALKKQLPNLQITNTTQRADLFKSVNLRPPTFSGKVAFRDSLKIVILTGFSGVEARYTLDGSEPNETSMLFRDSIMVDKTCEVKAIAWKDGWEPSESISKQCIKIPKLAKKVIWSKAPGEDYPGDGTVSISDLVKGGTSVKTKGWVGWQGSHITLTLDYGELISMEKLYVGHMNNTNAWVFAPRGLEAWTSKDGQSFTRILKKDYPAQEDPSQLQLLTLIESFPQQTARYIKVKVYSQLRNPKWHLSPGDKSWLFLDEVSVE